ncbi:MAG: sodium:proton antiporter [Acidobacteriota bacterium]|nr:sodium:proton antiporter [Thermoanaerobaculaceae bacterium]
MRFYKTALFLIFIFVGSFSAYCGEENKLGEILPLYSILPFAGILLSISLFPLFFPHFWHKRYPLVALFWGVSFIIPFLIAYKDTAVLEVLHIFLLDYVPFLILLWGLFTVSGGIVFKGSIVGTPFFNTILIAVGTVLASFMGTTGAAMLLIRPLLRANEKRKYKTHAVIFFIFLVANIGGSLTPLGDPPLFLGFLHGVPFFWTFKLFLPLVFASLMLLGVFFLLDSYYFRKENLYAVLKSQTKKRREPFKIMGTYNFLFLLGIIGSVLFSGTFHLGYISFFSVHLEYQDLIREIATIIIGIASLKVTPKDFRESNGFNWEPMKEVAILFAAIFATMIAPLAVLKAGDKGHLAFLVGGLHEPYQFFWLTGMLSSFLDNAPTYLTFLNMALGHFSPGVAEKQAIKELIQNNELFLEAISIGAVFMGANTYIGNAPNFMVKSIAEENGVKMPSFLGYIFKWSIPFLIPLFFLVEYIFL